MKRNSPVHILVIGDVNDPVIHQTLETLRSTIPRTKIIMFNELWLYTLTTFKDLIVIGHGNRQGIQYSAKVIIPWQNLGLLLSNLDVEGKIILLACDSMMISSYVQRNEVIAFEGDIDGVVASLFSAIVIRALRGTLPKKDFYSIFELMMSRVALLSTHPDFISKLGLSTEEIALGAAALFVTIAVQALFIWGVRWVLNKYGNAIKNALIKQFSKISGLSGLIAKVAAGGGSGSSNYIDTIKKLASLLYTIVVKGVNAFIKAAQSTMSWLDWAIMGASFVASVAAIFTTGSTSVILGIIAAAWPVWKVVRDIHYNYVDNNNRWEDKPFSLTWDILGGW